MMPKFKILRGEDDTLQFFPERGSRELADALSYHYPMQKTLLEKMQQASLDFLAGKAKYDVQVQRHVEPTKLSHHLPEDFPKDMEEKGREDPSAAGSSLSMHLGVWHVETGNPVHKHRRKRPYEPARRKIIAANRGNTCAKHKRSKTRCDPSSCPDNKLFRKFNVTEKRSSRERGESWASPDTANPNAKSPPSINTHGSSPRLQMEQYESTATSLPKLQSDSSYFRSCWSPLLPCSNMPTLSAITSMNDGLETCASASHNCKVIPTINTVDIFNHDLEVPTWQITEGFPNSWFITTPVDNLNRPLQDAFTKSDLQIEESPYREQLPIDSYDWLEFENSETNLLDAGLTFFDLPETKARSVSPPSQYGQLRKREKKRRRVVPVCIEKESEHTHSQSHTGSEPPPEPRNSEEYDFCDEPSSDSIMYGASEAYSTAIHDELGDDMWDPTEPSWGVGSINLGSKAQASMQTCSDANHFKDGFYETRSNLRPDDIGWSGGSWGASRMYYRLSSSDSLYGGTTHLAACNTNFIYSPAFTISPMVSTILTMWLVFILFFQAGSQSPRSAAPSPRSEEQVHFEAQEKDAKAEGVYHVPGAYPEDILEEENVFEETCPLFSVDDMDISEVLLNLEYDRAVAMRASKYELAMSNS